MAAPRLVITLPEPNKCLMEQVWYNLQTLSLGNRGSNQGSLDLESGVFTTKLHTPTTNCENLWKLVIMVQLSCTDPALAYGGSLLIPTLALPSPVSGMLSCNNTRQPCYFQADSTQFPVLYSRPLTFWSECPFTDLDLAFQITALISITGCNPLKWHQYDGCSARVSTGYLSPSRLLKLIKVSPGSATIFLEPPVKPQIVTSPKM